MDNFITRLVKRTLGLTPVVQPMIASLFAPTEVVLDSYSSGFEVENNTKYLFSGGESSSSLSPDNLPVRSPISLSESTSSFSENRIYSLSTLEQVVEAGKNQETVDFQAFNINQSDANLSIVAPSDRQINSTQNQLNVDEITDKKNVEFETASSPDSSLSPEVISSQISPKSLSKQTDIGEVKQSDKANNSPADGFDIELTSNFNQNPSKFSPNPNPTLSNRQPNAFNVVSSSDLKPATPNQINSEKILERVEPLVKQEIEIKPQISPDPPLSQEIISSPILPESLSKQTDIGEIRRSDQANNSPADGFEIELTSNFNQNPSKFSPNPNPTLSNKQENAFNIVRSNDLEPATPNQINSENILERVEPLVLEKIETKPKITTHSSNVKIGESQLETNPQNKNIPAETHSNNLSQRQNPLGRIKSLVVRIFQTQQPGNNILSSPQDRVELPTNSLPSNLNEQSKLSDTPAQVYPVQPPEYGAIKADKNIEESTRETGRLKSNNSVNVSPDISPVVYQDNPDINEQVKRRNIFNPQITELPLVDSEAVKKVRHYENFGLNPVESINDNEVRSSAESIGQTPNINRDKNHANANKLIINNPDNIIVPPTNSNPDKIQISSENRLDNKGILHQQKTPLFTPQSNQIWNESQSIERQKNNPTPVSSTPQLDQPLTLPSKQRHLIKLGENVSSEQQENQTVENKERPEIKPDVNRIANQSISRITPMIVNSKPRVNRRLESEPQISSELLKLDDRREQNRELISLTRRVLSVLSESSSKQLSVEPSANKLGEFRQLNSGNRREIFNSDRTALQKISDTEMTIQITIGRLEVRAKNPAASPNSRSKSTQREPKLSLQDYLKQRQGEK
ncbi:hypothetical protein ACL6C3_12485 [Capilliphycus salinus ALCB114379]|uniref:hypothetical protein n=1 Tax=Capilliphycus salinus TaxID=2768948 RepID=UPI0039A4C876